MGRLRLYDVVGFHNFMIFKEFKMADIADIIEDFKNIGKNIYDTYSI